MKRPLLIAAGFAAAAPLRAEVLNFSVNATTNLGQSIYVTTEHPLMGADSIVRSVKLSPHAYPVWQASFDLPAGITVTPKYYKRADAPDQAGGTTAELVQTGAPVTTSGSAGSNWPVTWYASTSTASAVVRITSLASGFSQTEIPMTFTDVGGGVRRFAATIPATHRAYGRRYQIVATGITLPSDGAALIPDGPVWWRHDQAFTYDVADLTLTPAAQRRVDFTFTLTGFDSRTIRVLLPRDYDRNTAKHYPVLYAEDGQNVFTPGGPFGTWNLDGIAASLTRRGEIPETIFVGIDNTSARNSEYSPEYSTLTPHRGGEYLGRVRDQLIPEINTRYRTLTGPEYAAHLGSSLGGCIGYQAAADFSATWGSIGALSTAFWTVMDGSTERAERGPANFSRVWIDSGNAGSSNDDYWNTYSIRDAMIESGFAFGPDFYHVIGVGQQHNEAAWSQRTPDVLRWMYAPLVAEFSQASSAANDAWTLY